MQYAIYFERDHARSHISLSEWQRALDETAGVRRADKETAEPDWIGYYVNQHSTGAQFHDSPDRVNDADVFFPEHGRWKRAFYWSSLPGTQCGVICFEDVPGSVDEAVYPVSVAAAALARRLNASLVGEDESAYEP